MENEHNNLTMNLRSVIYHIMKNLTFKHFPTSSPLDYTRPIVKTLSDTETRNINYSKH